MMQSSHFYLFRVRLLLFFFLCLPLSFNTLLQVVCRSPTEGTYYRRLPKSSAIKVIDFGSTAYEDQDHNYIVSTRHYRAPEVILGMLLLRRLYISLFSLHSWKFMPLKLN